ncbi:DsbA family protein [Jiella pacifica]|uniref:Thioredoxin domain-containing protein n=1 Tax=Jiella pacifica TaxID=2696469 RepID=A0A6N9T3Z4_9HYPH|nr:DsbA family protein [Jiella pacifica]NDW05292.1 thioredoxin domain-containing protein [Jiella pacifica]
MVFKRSAAVAFAAILTAGAFGAPARAQDQAKSFDAKQTSEIEAIVRNYLVTHPEVLVEAINALEAKRTAEAAASQKDAITENAASIFSTPEGTALGNSQGDVTVVEFFDYNCGYCKHALSDMDTLLKADPNVRFILKEIPVLGPQSTEASRVSLAFRSLKPEAYGDFHRKLLASRGTADEARAIAVAAEFGVDAGALKAAMASPEIAADIAKDKEVAEALGVNGTPSYVIEDTVLPGAVGIDNLQAAIANVRSCGSTTC